jgi:RNA polymerase sigma factor (sigma-70 family)
MAYDVQTRATLLLRLRDQADDDSWSEFADIYTPLIFGYCQRRELKHADIADITQEVMRSISISLAKGQYDPEKGKFKAWLFTTVRNAISTHFRKLSRAPLTISETSLLDKINATPSAIEQQDWERDYQSQLLSWAIEKVRPEFADRIWRAFEATALEERSPEDVAIEINMTPNAIGVAKHRVLKRLKEKAQSVDTESWEQEMIQRSRT